MLLTTAIGLFLGFWSLIYLIDYYFRYRSLQKYVSFVERTGLVVSPFQLRLYTAKFQRFLSGWQFLKGPKVKRFLDLWFSFGVASAIIALIFMIYLLTTTLLGQLYSTLNYATQLIFSTSTASTFGATTTSPFMNDGATSPSYNGPSIVPVIPGVNLPWNQVPLLFCVLIVSGVVHELGHAVAALNENVTVNGFGLFVLFIYPGAFTELENDGLETASVWKRLKIFCGGIWHNLATALLAFICISSMPRLLSFAYITNKGVVVTQVATESGLTIDGGLRAGDVVYEINYCKVFNEDAWIECLSMMVRKNYGYCIPKNQARYASSSSPTLPRLSDVNGELHCCDTNSSASHLCFYYKTPTTTSFNETSSAAVKLTNVFEYSCLPARYVTDHYICNYSLPCGPQALCVYPALFNNTKLFRFQLENHSKPILFIGYPRAISAHVAVSGYVPKFSYAPIWLPPFLDLFLRYLFTFSLALGLLNAVPCYSLDGQFIIGVVMDARCYGRRKQTLNRRRRNLFYKSVMMYGTVLLVSVVVVGLVSFLKPIFIEF